jgi:hypothetical protein
LIDSIKKSEEGIENNHKKVQFTPEISIEAPPPPNKKLKGVEVSDLDHKDQIKKSFTMEW